MSALPEILSALWSGFQNTILLVVLSAAFSLVLGTALATMRVSTVHALRAVGTAYVGVVRNFPLPVLLYFTILVLPQLVVVSSSFFVLAAMSLVIYYGAFVGEAVRSGVNLVRVGEAEAARSLGLRNGQVLRLVIIPQALRSVLPPLVSLFIQLIRSSAVAGGFGVAELFSKMNILILDHGNLVIQILLITACFYLVITIPAGLLLGLLERRVSVVR